MNMICCGEQCRHQKNGYCILDGRARITDSASSGCCYFEQSETLRGGSGYDKGGEADKSI